MRFTRQVRVRSVPAGFIALVVAFATLIGIAGPPIPAAVAAVPSVTVWESDLVHPTSIAVGADGAFWFTNQFGNSIGRSTVDGIMTHFTDPGIDWPIDIVAGPDDALWFTNSAIDGAPHPGSIGRITTAGVVTQFSDPAINFARDIAVGPDGALWFTADTSIGRITTAGVITMYPSPWESSGSITAGSDGAMWFTTYEALVGRIAMDGTFSSQPLLGGVTASGGITTGPDGALWLPGGSGINRLTTAGGFTHYQVDRSQLAAIVVGPDGALWFSGFRSIGRITTDGDVSTTTLVRRQVADLVVGPDNHLWGAGSDQLLQLESSGITASLVATIANPGDLAAGPDGEMVVMNRGGSFASFLGGGAPFAMRPDGVDSPSAGVAGPDRAFWVVNGPHEIAIWRGSRLTRFASSKIVSPTALAVGPDRRIWFANSDKSLGRSNPDGSFSRFAISRRATSMVTGADGALWFATGGSLGRITPAGVVSEQTVRASASSIIRDANDTLWFASNGALGQIRTGGTVTLLPVLGMLDTFDIAPGTDGAIWFIDAINNRIGRRTQAGGVSYYDPGMRFVDHIAPGADGAMWYSGARGVGRITTPGPVQRPKVNVGDAALVEGNAWSRRMPVNLTLSTPSVTPITAGVVFGGPDTTTNASDVSLGTNVVTFLPGDTSATVSFMVNPDRAIEHDEHFTIDGMVLRGTADLGRASGRGVILNDDPPDSGPVLSVGNASAVEGGSGTRRLRIAVTLSDIARSPVRVKWTTAPSAGSETEYIRRYGVLEIPAGATERDLTVLIKGDNRVEPNQRFQIWLWSPENAQIRRAVGVATIIDDD